MLTDWINEGNIELIPYVKNWRDAVETAVRPLITTKAVEQRYLDAIFTLHEQIGPYYVLGEGIAMPHARPEEGVNKTALSLLIISGGVEFGSEENDPVYIVFALSAIDSHSHIDMIAGLSHLFCDDQKINQLKNATSKLEVLEIIRQF
ncbi:PTS sugar transporter subunit IIA [Biostraticola tofi]|uniref:PTS system IIA component (L-Asc family) n=1 Tax=Biostraticola tofi TaxID=466109 RepID=A0A4R3YW19_9GAMM|nr:PTS sugar transporter subunit IIA [Biostraticola tofi]TCV95453.1 PTS system IIA component (L-Asc family) [Biostraticola tofi]